MKTEQFTARWQKRIQEIDSRFEKVRFPRAEQDGVPQDQEWCEVQFEGEIHRIRFHDYDEIFRIPGLYEHLFYEKLECTSPSRVAHLLEDVLEDFTDDPDDLHVLDVGAGNGMVGDELDEIGVQELVGVDIIPEAREATFRDRPGLYHDYIVTDLTSMPEMDELKLRKYHFNCLCTVAALGFGDIPPRAFLKALDLVETPAWIAYTIKEDFINGRDECGFSRLIRQLSYDGIIQPQAYRRYRHRISMTGEPLYYVAMVARKLEDLPDHMLEEQDN